MQPQAQGKFQAPPMLTQCPNCETRFRVTAEILKAAAGNVRCSHCNQIFNALNQLQEASARKTSEPPADIELISEEALTEAEEYDQESTAALSEAPALIADDLRAFERSRKRGWRTVFGLMTALLLSASLAVQAGYFMRDEFNQYPWLQPWLERLCAQLECKVEIPRNTKVIKVSERDVRRHPDIPNALLINVTLINNAPFAQPYPVMVLSFSDVGGRPLARRYFEPDNYLGNTQPGDELMPRETPILVVLEIVDPGEQAVSFQFDFL